MEEQSNFAKQNRIIAAFESNERRMKRVLLAIIICVISLSSVMSLTFSYKAYKEVKGIVNKQVDTAKEEISFETLVVSYSNGSLLTCNDAGCGNTMISITNEGNDSAFCSINFVDTAGDGTYYEYLFTSADQTLKNAVPAANVIAVKEVEIKPGESKEYSVALNSIDGINHDNYQMRLQVDLDTGKSMLLE